MPRGLHGRDKQEALGIRNRLLLYEQHFAAQQILQPDEHEQAVQQVREAPSPATPQQLHAALPDVQLEADRGAVRLPATRAPAAATCRSTHCGCRGARRRYHRGIPVRSAAANSDHLHLVAGIKKVLH